MRQKPRRHRLRIGRFSAGMYLIRLAFAATAVRLKQGRTGRGGATFIGDERTSVSAGNEALARLRRPTLSLSTSFHSYIFLHSLYLALLVAIALHSLSSRTKIVFISHLLRSQVNIMGECTHLPLRAMTSKIHDAEKSTLSPRHYT